MNAWPKITLTGADEHTDLDKLRALVDSDPCIEVGLLYSETPEGRNRYPSRDWLIRAANAFSGRCAIHVCGSVARDRFLLTIEPILSLAGCAARWQVNGKLSIPWVETVCEWYDDTAIITQHNERNAPLLGVKCANHCLLVDASGGRGMSPREWVRPTTGKAVGFAGGLGPDNLESELPKIMAVATGEWWLDMETGLRDEDDWFDIGRARKAVEVFQKLVAKGNGDARKL